MKRSTIFALHPEDREWLESELLRRNFSDYKEIAEGLTERCTKRGQEPVSKSAVHRFGQGMEENTRRIKAATEMAKVLSREVGDDEGALSDAIMRTVQTSVFGVLADLDIDPDSKDVGKLVKLGHLAADLARATVQQKRHMAAVKAAASAAAETVTAKVRKAGLTEEAVDSIRREILGITDAK